MAVSPLFCLGLMELVVVAGTILMPTPCPVGEDLEAVGGFCMDEEPDGGLLHDFLRRRQQTVNDIDRNEEQNGQRHEGQNQDAGQRTHYQNPVQIEDPNAISNNWISPNRPTDDPPLQQSSGTSAPTRSGIEDDQGTRAYSTSESHGSSHTGVLTSSTSTSVVESSTSSTMITEGGGGGRESASNVRESPMATGDGAGASSMYETNWRLWLMEAMVMGLGWIGLDQCRS